MLKIINDHQINLTLQIKTNAPKRKIKVYDDAIDVYVKSPPAKGKANKEILEYFSDLLNLDQKYLQLVKGKKSSNKILAVYTSNIDEIETILSKFRPSRTTQ